MRYVLLVVLLVSGCVSLPSAEEPQRFWRSHYSTVAHDGGVSDYVYVLHDTQARDRCVLVVQHDIWTRPSVAMLPWPCE